MKIRTTIYLDEQVRRELKIAAAQSDLSVSQILELSASRYLSDLINENSQDKEVVNAQ